MKATGVVRRIDDLGRVVIPKEIRRTLRIKEGDSLEIYVDNTKHVVLKKHSIVQSIEEIAQFYCDALYVNTKANIIVTDNEKIIASSSNIQNKVKDQKITEDVISLMNTRKTITIEQDTETKITDQLIITDDCLFKTLYMLGDAVGSIFIYGENVLNKEVNILLDTASDFINYYLEN